MLWFIRWFIIVLVNSSQQNNRTSRFIYWVSWSFGTLMGDCFVKCYFQGQVGTLKLNFYTKMDEKSLKCSEKMLKCKHLQLYMNLIFY